MLRRFSPLSSWRKRSYCSSMYSKMAPKLFELSMASPKPGVSTTVRRSLTPRSSISTVEASNLTVCFCFSAEQIDYWLVRYKGRFWGNYLAYLWHRVLCARDINRLGTGCSPASTCPALIRPQPSAWTRNPSSPTCDALDWADWQSPHIQGFRC